ncbi:MAG: hypothetical protein NTZ27_03710 [Ignavibacteriales bacterium]|nr:hypothetical protein [Ignavibacteriales bacterium]
MELIPILSLIILVATISTFILAVGAYILYKVRERKGITAQAAQPSAIPAELVAPAPLMQEQRIITPERRTFEPQSPQQEYGYEYQRQPAYIPQEEQSRGPELKPTFVGSAPTNGQRGTGENARTNESERSASGSKKKYMRYTNEGYVEPTRQDRKQEDNLRWR